MALVLLNAKVHIIQIKIQVNVNLVQQTVYSVQVQQYAINAHQHNIYSKANALLNVQVERNQAHK